MDRADLPAGDPTGAERFDGEPPEDSALRFQASRRPPAAVRSSSTTRADQAAPLPVGVKTSRARSASPADTAKVTVRAGS